MTLREPESIDLPTPSGPMRTLVLRPEGDGRHPGLIFHSEIFQLTGPIRRTAAFLAGHGFIVALPEIYHEHLPAGTVLGYDAAGSETGNRLKTTKALQGYDDDNRALLAYLRNHPAGNGRVGAFGPCIGGHLAFRAALLEGVGATACFYPTDLHKRGLGAGQNDDSLARAGEIRGEVMMILGRQDPHVPAEGRDLIRQTLAAAGVHFTWHEVNAAHAFLRDEGLRYDAELSRQLLGQALDLFRRRLG